MEEATIDQLYILLFRQLRRMISLIENEDNEQRIKHGLGKFTRILSTTK